MINLKSLWVYFWAVGGWDSFPAALAALALAFAKSSSIIGLGYDQITGCENTTVVNDVIT